MPIPFPVAYYADTKTRFQRNLDRPAIRLANAS